MEACTMQFGTDVREIPLTRGYVALVDATDWTTVDCGSWWALCSGGLQYAARDYWSAGKKTTVLMHRLLLGFPTGLVDHVNCIGTDNRRCNLRLATQSQNHANQRKRDGLSSRFKGVSWRRGAWIATIKRDKRQRYLGTFTTEEAAARAYDEAAIALFGEFARTNLVYSPRTIQTLLFA